MVLYQWPSPALGNRWVLTPSLKCTIDGWIYIFCKKCKGQKTTTLLLSLKFFPCTILHDDNALKRVFCCIIFLLDRDLFFFSPLEVIWWKLATAVQSMVIYCDSVMFLWLKKIPEKPVFLSCVLVKSHANLQSKSKVAFFVCDRSGLAIGTNLAYLEPKKTAKKSGLISSNASDPITFFFFHWNNNCLLCTEWLLKVCLQLRYRYNRLVVGN